MQELNNDSSLGYHTIRHWRQELDLTAEGNEVYVSGTASASESDSSVSNHICGTPSSSNFDSSSISGTTGRVHITVIDSPMSSPSATEDAPRAEELPAYQFAPTANTEDPTMPLLSRQTYDRITALECGLCELRSDHDRVVHTSVSLFMILMVFLYPAMLLLTFPYFGRWWLVLLNYRVLSQLKSRKNLLHGKQLHPNETSQYQPLLSLVAIASLVAVNNLQLCNHSLNLLFPF
ncbi:hypothetical protein K469DRAFT_686480 [Zopfia rhizophila CBS 207.26]|uniref:Uncharacterized protein n=1 Tax=Zopfia rhizophila CBS 207.26 TaxID=1314779 RepID=A0A6A6EX06_9PEZI|nr:hypothetical protein K469DRAFT_686480 [Zopfia rhizophila CBS 207.26]